MFKHYLKEIHASLGYFATWLPNVPLELGAVGVIDRDGRFRPATTIDALIGPQRMVKGRARAPINHHSVTGVTVTFKLAGAALIPNSPLTIQEAGVAVELGAENGIVFEAAGCTIDRIEDVDEIGTELLNRANAGAWNADYIIITEIVRAKTATVLMSKAAGARFDATVRAGVALDASTSLADANLGLGVKHKHNVGIEVIAEANLTPLFTAWRVRKSWWRDGKWEPAKSALQGPLEKLDPDALLESSATA